MAVLVPFSFFPNRREGRAEMERIMLYLFRVYFCALPQEKGSVDVICYGMIRGGEEGRKTIKQ